MGFKCLNVCAASAFPRVENLLITTVGLAGNQIRFFERENILMPECNSIANSDWWLN
jgi:hypothetical protein